MAPSTGSCATGTSGCRTWWARPEILAGRIADLQRRAADAGRDPIPVTLFAAKPEARALNRLREAGVDRALILVRSADAASTEARLDELAAIVAEARAG